LPAHPARTRPWIAWMPLVLPLPQVRRQRVPVVCRALELAREPFRISRRRGGRDAVGHRAPDLRREDITRLVCLDPAPGLVGGDVELGVCGRGALVGLLDEAADVVEVDLIASRDPGGLEAVVIDEHPAV